MSVSQINAIGQRFERIHSSIDVLFHSGVMLNIRRLLKADQIAREQAKLAHQVAFDMKKGKA